MADFVTEDGFYEWNEDKAASNIEDHDGVSFAEASTVFADPNQVLLDPGDKRDHRAVGFSFRGRLLTVVHEERGSRDRIISAWVSTPTEQRAYRGK